jgi:hypothetical protein
MSDLPALRASDADRDRMVMLLREHAAQGRLTLEEFTERMSAAYLARTHDELDELSRDLPVTQATVASRRRPTRFVFALLGSTERAGYVPEGVEIDLHGLAIGGHKGAYGNDPLPVAGTPLVRVFVISIFAGIDVWRVPRAWTEKSWGDVIDGLSPRKHRELGA